MRRIVLACLAPVFLLSIAGCGTYYPAYTKQRELQRFARPTTPAAERRSHGAVISIWNESGEGTAVAITSDGKLLTAWHVIDGANVIGGSNASSKPKTLAQWRKRNDGHAPWVRLHGNYGGLPFSRVRLLAASPQLDLAIVSIDQPTPWFVSPAAKGPRAGDPMLLMGGSGGVVRSTAGPYLRYERRVKIRNGGQVDMTLGLDAPAFPGDSGGALLNGKGELVGILMATGGAAMMRDINAGLGPDEKIRFYTMASPTPPAVIRGMLQAGIRVKAVRLKGVDESASIRKFWPRLHVR
jgi:S1-C subfamily serine protease